MSRRPEVARDVAKDSERVLSRSSKPAGTAGSDRLAPLPGASRLASTPLAASLGGPLCAETVSLLLTRARDLLGMGMAPRHERSACLRAVAPVLSFIHERAELCDEASLRPEIRRAVLRIAQELESPSVPPLSIPVPLPVQHEEAVRTGALLLAAYRAAVERSEGTGPQVIAFGCQEDTRPTDGLAVADGIARFLAAAVNQPQVLVRAGLSGRQLAGLEAQGRVLRAHAAQRETAAHSADSEQRTRIMHLVLENFFGRFEAAVNARLTAQPALRQRALRLLPGRGLVPGSDRPAYASCHVTDSGRLVYVC